MELGSKGEMLKVKLPKAEMIVDEAIDIKKLSIERLISAVKREVKFDRPIDKESFDKFLDSLYEQKITLKEFHDIVSEELIHNVDEGVAFRNSKQLWQAMSTHLGELGYEAIREGNGVTMLNHGVLEHVENIDSNNFFKDTLSVGKLGSKTNVEGSVLDNGEIHFTTGNGDSLTKPTKTIKVGRDGLEIENFSRSKDVQDASVSPQEKSTTPMTDATAKLSELQQEAALAEKIVNNFTDTEGKLRLDGIDIPNPKEKIQYLSKQAEVIKRILGCWRI
jgi:hypothetical protein